MTSFLFRSCIYWINVIIHLCFLGLVTFQGAFWLVDAKEVVGCVVERLHVQVGMLVVMRALFWIPIP